MCSVTKIAYGRRRILPPRKELRPRGGRYLQTGKPEMLKRRAATTSGVSVPNLRDTIRQMGGRALLERARVSRPTRSDHANPVSRESCRLAARYPETAPAGEPLRISLALSGFGEPEATPILHYRHTDQTEGLFDPITMKRAATMSHDTPTDDETAMGHDTWTTQGPGAFLAIIPGE